MTETSETNLGSGKRRLFGWILFPIALFPLAALLTYDWRATDLQIPAAHSTNWIGPLGDFFAYYGYCLLGFAVWILPVYCIVISCRIIAGESLRPGIRLLWRSLLLVAAASLLQIMEHNAPGIKLITEKTNVMNAGGVIGYLISDKILIPLFYDIGASVIALIALVFSLIGAIGMKNISSFFVFIYRWATAASAPTAASPEESAAIQAAREAAMRAKEDARRQKEAEKEAARKRKAEDAQRKAAAAVATPSAHTNTPPPPSKSTRPRTTSESASAPGAYILPPVDLLDPLKITAADHSDVDSMAETLISTLQLFGVSASLSYTVCGPVVTKYAVKLAPGTLYNAVSKIYSNLKGALRAKSLRLETPIPGEEEVGIEVPNKNPAGISFREIFESDKWQSSKAELPLLFGKDAAGNELIADLASMPHMLVAGATGQGKSVCLNSLINGLLMTRTPEQLRFIMVDPKSVEFTPYSKIPHLLVPVITENKKVLAALQWAVGEMEKRLKMFAEAGVRNIHSFNTRKTFLQTDMFGDDSGLEPSMPASVPYIVIIIDEVADLMSECAKEVVPGISRLTAKARAAGIHLILATQRPDTQVITGTIKANIPGRVAFKTSQAIDSRTILDAQGAENLIGRGDMLFKSKDGELIRAQGAWISDDEINRVTGFIQEHSTQKFDEAFKNKLDKVKAVKDDDGNTVDDDQDKPTKREIAKAASAASDVKKAIACLINTKRASVSHFQRQMGWGYNHAAVILDKLADQGIVSQASGMGPRQILMEVDALERLLNEDDAPAENAGEEDSVDNQAIDDDNNFTEEQI